MLIVDAHAHIYSDDDRLYPPVARPYRPPAGTGTVAHLQRERKAAGVRHVLAVQATTYYGWDNRFLVDAARANSEWMAGICTLDPDDKNSPALIEQYAQGHNIVGIRCYQAADGRLDHPGVVRLWEAARRWNLALSVRIHRDKAAELAALLRRFPGLKVVLDHGLYVSAGPEYDRTLRDVLDLARSPDLHAKLSFLPTGSARPYPFDDMHEACRRIIDAYGADRCLWGSAFPCELWCPRTTYAQQIALFARGLGLDDRSREAILGKTAYRLYFERKTAPLPTTRGTR
jgi:predicted TIM-barrel fold metal-dependent hydrolase